MTTLKLAAASALVLSGVFLAAPASAAPMLDPGVAHATDVAKPEAVRWVCGPYRCWWRPNYGFRGGYRGGYGFYGGGYGYRPYGYRYGY